MAEAPQGLHESRLHDVLDSRIRERRTSRRKRRELGRIPFDERRKCVLIAAQHALNELIVGFVHLARSPCSWSSSLRRGTGIESTGLQPQPICDAHPNSGPRRVHSAIAPQGRATRRLALIPPKANEFDSA